MRFLLISFVSAVLVAVSGCYTQPPAPTVDRGVRGYDSPGYGAASSAVVGEGFYVVKPRDTLYRIALEHGQDYRDIAQWNNITDPSMISEGQVLRVAPPVGSSPSNSNAEIAAPITATSEVEERNLDGSALVAAPSSAANSALSAGVKQTPKVNKEAYSDDSLRRIQEAAGLAAAASATENAAKIPAAAMPSETADGSAAASKLSSATVDGVKWAWPVRNALTTPFSASGTKGMEFAGKGGDAIRAAAAGKVVYAGNGLRGYGELVIIKHSARYLTAYGHNRKILVKEGQDIKLGQQIAEMGNSDASSTQLHFEIRKQGKPVDPAQYLPKR